MDNDFLVLECRASGCTAQIYLNDILVLERGDEQGKQFSGPVNDLCVDGENELSLVVEPGGSPRHSLSGGSCGRRRAVLGRAEATAKLSRYPFGTAIGSDAGKLLLEVQWESSESGLHARWPQVRGARADLGAVSGRWSWQDAEQLEPGDKLLEAVHKLLSRHHRALSAGDPRCFLKESQPRLLDLQRAYGADPREKARLMEIVMAERVRAAEYAMEPIDPQDYDLLLSARGRLVECLTSSGTPILRDRPLADQSVASYPMRLALIDGALRIVR